MSSTKSVCTNGFSQSNSVLPARPMLFTADPCTTIIIPMCDKLGLFENNPEHSGGRKQIIFEHHSHYQKLLKEQIRTVKAKINVPPKVAPVHRKQDLNMQEKTFRAVSKCKSMTNTQQSLPLRHNRSHVNKYEGIQQREHMNRVIQQEAKIRSFKSAYNKNDKGVHFKKSEVKSKGVYDYRPVSSMLHNR